MPKEGMIESPYDVNQLINTQLIPYMTYEGSQEMLDLMRLIQESGNYYFKGIPFPESMPSIPAQATASGTVQLPVGTYITSLGYYCDPTANPEGLKFKIYDKGSKASIFYGDWSLDRISASSMSLLYGQGCVVAPTDPGMNADNPFGPNFLLSPFIITNPGILGWEIVNQSVAAAIIQVFVACAVPINADTIGMRTVRKG